MEDVGNEINRQQPCKPSVERCELGCHFRLYITSCEGDGLTRRGLVVAMEYSSMSPRNGTCRKNENDRRVFESSKGFILRIRKQTSDEKLSTERIRY